MEDWAVDLGRGLGRQLLVDLVHPQINNQCLAQARQVKKLIFHFTDSLPLSLLGLLPIVFKLCDFIHVILQ
jgi:hypothetical protein